MVGDHAERAGRCEEEEGKKLHQKGWSIDKIALAPCLQMEVGVSRWIEME